MAGSKHSMGTRFDCRVLIETRSMHSVAYIEGRLRGLMAERDLWDVQATVEIAGAENSEDATVGAGA